MSERNKEIARMLSTTPFRAGEPVVPDHIVTASGESDFWADVAASERERSNHLEEQLRLQTQCTESQEKLKKTAERNLFPWQVAAVFFAALALIEFMAWMARG